MRAFGPCHYRFARDTGAKRQTRSNSLCGCDDIRLHAKVLDRPPLSCATHSALDFVGDQHDSVFVAELAKRWEEPIRWDEISAFALYRFDQYTRNFITGY